MSTVYFHIGSPKTGTSLLQSVYEANRNVFESKEIEYISPKDIRGSKLLKSFIFYYRNSQRKNLNRTVINDFFLTKKYKDVFISEETFTHDFMPSEFANFGIDGIEKTIGFIQTLPFDNVKVILTVRNQLDFLLSVYSHFVFRHQQTDTLENWLKKVNLDNLSWKVRVIDKLHEAFGEDGVQVVPFETLKKQGVLAYANKTLQPLDIEVEKFNHQTLDQNASLSEFKLKILRSLNRIHLNEESRIMTAGIIKRAGVPFVKEKKLSLNNDLMTHKKVKRAIKEKYESEYQELLSKM